MNIRWGMAIVLLGCIVSGCAVGPQYHAPEPALPPQWHQAATDGLAPGAANLHEWWLVFADDQLSSLVHRAVEGNLDLRLAMLRVREARALRGVAAGELLPSLAGQGSYQRTKYSANGFFGGAIGRAAGSNATFAESVARGVASGYLTQGLGTILPEVPGLASSVAGNLVGMIPGRSKLPDTDEMNLFTTGFDASWEIDVFGGIRRSVEAADSELAATVEDYRSVQVSLLAEVAATYIDVRALQSQIEATRRNIELQKQTLSLTRARFDAQLTSELDVHQARTNLATTESELPLLESGLTLAVYRLGVLLGGEPAALYDELSASRAIPQPPSETFVGVPTDLLRRRPDIRAAERRLAAQTARIGVAAADLYPRFTLSGTLGFDARDFSHMLDGRSVTYGLGPAVHWSLFNGLRNLSRIAAQEAATHYAYVSYERTLLMALQDVESAMVAYKNEQARRDALLRAAEAARQAVQIAEKRYEDGLTDFQNVLAAQRSLVNLDNAVAQSRGQVAVYLVALYKALGGGWSPDQTPPAEDPDEGSAVLAHPLDFILSGGKMNLPWETKPDRNGESATTPTNEE
ncbi:MAG: efflux transporter outer membrane subunit [Phycisphaerae bacterium]|nr:efflux transporter outer membrane subunit [Phycisphaerae bacterium]